MSAMTQTLDVPKKDWARFLENLSSMSVMQPVRIEVEQSELGDQLVGKMLPLRGLELETKGSQSGDVLVYLGQDDATLSHRIAAARRIWAAYDEAKILRWVAIEQEDEGKTLLYFEQPRELTEEARG